LGLLPLPEKILRSHNILKNRPACFADIALKLNLLRKTPFLSLGVWEKSMPAVQSYNGQRFAWYRFLPRIALLWVYLPLCGCFHLGPDRLDRDAVGYSQALGDSQNQQTLLNVVRLRYADTPSFLQTTQIISSYQLQQSITGGLETYPGAATSAGNYLTAGATAQLQQSPTFTLQPIIGEQFAESFIRPLAPAELIPLVEGGIPIDVLFRLDVQSVNALQNARALSGSASQGSPLFFLLLHDLRVLQIAGLLDAGPQDGTDAAQKSRSAAQTTLVIGTTTDPDLTATEAEARRLLGMKPDSSTATVIYGAGKPASGQVRILTRPMLGILNQLAIQVDVPASDIASGRTIPSVGNIGIEHRPVVIVHSGSTAPDNAFVSVQYKHTWFWISDDDFDSKLAFSVVQTLLSLAQTTNAPGTIITIPAG
jgi:hypothetical protein